MIWLTSLVWTAATKWSYQWWYDWEIDKLLSQVPDPDNVCLQIPEPPKPSPLTPPSTWSLEPSPSSRFMKLFIDKEIQNLRKCVIPANTQKSTSFAISEWKEWSAHRKKMNQSDWPANLLILNDWELNRWLSRFVLEITRHGKEYPVNTWYQICCGILCYIQELKPQLDVCCDDKFGVFIKLSMLKWNIWKQVNYKCALNRLSQSPWWRGAVVEHFGVPLWNVFHSQKCERAPRLEAALIWTSWTRRRHCVLESVILLQVTKDFVDSLGL